MPKCLLCDGNGWHRLETPYVYEAYGEEFEMKALPCPLCPDGRRNAIMVARWDVRGARACKRSYRGVRLRGWLAPGNLVRRFPPMIEEIPDGIMATNDDLSICEAGHTRQEALNRYAGALVDVILRDGDPDLWPLAET